MIKINNDLRSKKGVIFELSNTNKNLLKAYDDELKASTRYNIFASKAKNDGYIQISNLFIETAHNEKEHAEVFLKLFNSFKESLDDGLNSTAQNLNLSHKLESTENINYRQYAQDALDEGFDTIADKFKLIANIELEHERRFKKLLDDINKERVFKREKKMIWLCTNCGCIVESESAPKYCPVCGHKQGYFEIKSDDNY